jgi:hypothetical protein
LLFSPPSPPRPQRRSKRINRVLPFSPFSAISFWNCSTILSRRAITAFTSSLFRSCLICSPIGWSQVPSVSPTTAIAAYQVTGVSQVFLESKCTAAIDPPNLPITLAVRRNGLICYLLQAGSADAVTRSRQVKQITTATMSLRHGRLSMCIGVPSPNGAYNLALRIPFGNPKSTGWTERPTSLDSKEIHAMALRTRKRCGLTGRAHLTERGSVWHLRFHRKLDYDQETGTSDRVGMFVRRPIRVVLPLGMIGVQRTRRRSRDEFPGGSFTR